MGSRPRRKCTGFTWVSACVTLPAANSVTSPPHASRHSPTLVTPACGLLCSDPLPPQGLCCPDTVAPESSLHDLLPHCVQVFEETLFSRQPSRTYSPAHITLSVSCSVCFSRLWSLCRVFLCFCESSALQLGCQALEIRGCVCLLTAESRHVGPPQLFNTYLLNKWVSEWMNERNEQKIKKTYRKWANYSDWQCPAENNPSRW